MSLVSPSGQVPAELLSEQPKWHCSKTFYCVVGNDIFRVALVLLLFQLAISPLGVSIIAFAGRRIPRATMRLSDGIDIFFLFPSKTIARGRACIWKNM